MQVNIILAMVLLFVWVVKQGNIILTLVLTHLLLVWIVMQVNIIPTVVQTLLWHVWVVKQVNIIPTMVQTLLWHVWVVKQVNIILTLVLTRLLLVWNVIQVIPLKEVLLLVLPVQQDITMTSREEFAMHVMRGNIVLGLARILLQSVWNVIQVIPLK